MRSRGWSIRAKIMTLAVLPLVAITGLAIFGVAATIGPALNLLETNQYDQTVTNNGEPLMVELQHERRLSGTRNAGSELQDQRIKTDQHYQVFMDRWEADNGRENLPAGHVAVVDAFIANMAVLPQIRSDLDTGQTDAATAISRYNDVIDAAYIMFAPLTHVSNAELTAVANGLFKVSRAREMLAREDATVAAAIADNKISATEHGRVVLAIGARRQLQEEALAALTPPHSENYAKIFSGDAYQTMYAMEEALGTLRSSGVVPIDATIWRESAAAVLNEMDDTEGAAARSALDIANRVGLRAFSLPLIAGLAGLLFAALTLVLALRTGRSVVRRLERLRVSALSIANEQLPKAIATLRQPGVVPADPPVNDVPLAAMGTDEVGQVAHAFDAVQRTAIRAAVDEATLRRGVSEVFLNIARRSQALLHRQLTLLDRMERRTTTPQELEDLFKLDHMATRMRRHAEALVILAGSAPGRGWRHPVPVIDVVRGAVSEIEDYVRVTMERLPDVRIVGRAVGDLIHLLAELLENSAQFAPPHTQVRVYADLVAQGLVIHIEDRGLGMSEQELAEANMRLASPPAFDPTNSARLGLLAVARLAARQGVMVRLRPSPYGGVTAVVLVPNELVLKETGEPVNQPLPSAMPQQVVDAPHPMEDKANQTTVAIVDGLPRRVRKAIPVQSDGGDGETTATVMTDANTVDMAGADPEQLRRHADETRARMSAFQSGSVRARARAAEVEGRTDATEEGSAFSGTDNDPTHDRLAP